VATGDGGLEVVLAFADVLTMVDGVVAVDMPIGLPAEQASRACDVLIRRQLGPRRSSVFPAPGRGVLSASSFADVTGLSIQAWNLVAKIREVDLVWVPRVVEVSPELSLATMAGAPMAWPKRRTEGLAERLVTLGLDAVPRVRGAAADDVVDALACLWTAQRVAAGTAVTFGDGTIDDHGRPMCVHA
jgi:predicted RNase H-like nuclease